jgi:hypothetical protein
MKRVNLFLLVTLAAALVIGSSELSFAGDDSASGKMNGFPKGGPPAFQLMRLVQNVGKLDKGNKGHLSADQAKSILNIVQPLRKQTSLTRDQAQDALGKINGLLTEEQKTLVDAMKPDKNKHGMGGGGSHHFSGNEPSEQSGEHHHFNGGGMANGGGMTEDFNPFNPPKDAPMAKDLAKQWNDLFNKFGKIAGIKAVAK